MAFLECPRRSAHRVAIKRRPSQTYGTTRRSQGVSAWVGRLERGRRLGGVRLRTWRDLVAAVYDSAEIAEMIRATKVRDLLTMASRPGIPEGLFNVLASSIASDPERTPAERGAARRALRTERRLESERVAIERERVRAEFARLPAAPPSPVVYEGLELNPFVDALSGALAEKPQDDAVTGPTERQT